jgi:type IX secretion system PorP/SprF family membrane protein
MRKLLLHIFFCIIAVSVSGQDVQYSQFYNDPLYINPALAGAGKYNRAGIHFRDQWPGITEAYKTYSGFIDRFSKKLNSGFGLTFAQDVAGSGALKFTNLGINYSYLAVFDRFNSIRLGAKFDLSNRSVNFDKILFADQVIRDFDPNTIEEFETNSVYYANFGAGFEYNNTKSHLRIGAAIDHLNEPNQSFTSVPYAVKRLYSAYFLYNLYIRTYTGSRSDAYFKIGAYYKNQEKWDQLEFGTNFHNQDLEIGLWYRGLPNIKSYKSGFSNNEAVIIYLGYQFQVVHIGYNYDLTVSRLIQTSSNGAHEVTMVYAFRDPKKRGKKKRIIPCSDILGNSVR